MKFIYVVVTWPWNADTGEVYVYDTPQVDVFLTRDEAEAMQAEEQGQSCLFVRPFPGVTV